MDPDYTPVHSPALSLCTDRRLAVMGEPMQGDACCAWILCVTGVSLLWSSTPSRYS